MKVTDVQNFQRLDAIVQLNCYEIQLALILVVISDQETVEFICVY